MLRQLIVRTQLSDILKDVMKIAEKEKEHVRFLGVDSYLLYTLPSGGSASLQLYMCYVSSLHDNWIRDNDMSVPGPAADQNRISIRIGPLYLVVRVLKPMRVYLVPGCVYKTAKSTIFWFIVMT